MSATKTTKRKVRGLNAKTNTVRKELSDANIKKLQAGKSVRLMIDRMWVRLVPQNKALLNEEKKLKERLREIRKQIREGKK